MRCNNSADGSNLSHKAGRSEAFTANKELRYLRAMFNFGIKQGLVKTNPTQGLEFMPVDKKIKYIPTKEDVARVLLAADPDTQDYLMAMKETMARMGEINQLTWDDVDLERKTLGFLGPALEPQSRRVRGRPLPAPQRSHGHAL